MKKIIAALLCIILTTLSFSGCSNIYSKSGYFHIHTKTEVIKITKSLEYYNKKAIDNIDKLIGAKPEDCQLWINEVFESDKLIKTNFDFLSDDGETLAYLSKDNTVQLYFIFEDGFNRFFIKPNLDDSPEASYPQFASKRYKDKVNKFCAEAGSDLKNAPLICELCLYNFDKADSDTELCFFYLFDSQTGWGWNGDKGPYNSKSFYYNCNEMTFKEKR